MPLLMILPPALFAGLAGLFLAGMFRDDPDALPSTFIGTQAPALPAVALGTYPTFASDDLANGEVKMVNFFASWCPPCRAEHPALMQLAEEGVAVYGVNKSDPTDTALEFLDELGNPYRAITVDRNGRHAIDWGVVALPETFVLDGDGTVVLKFSGPIHGVMDSIIRPALAEAAKPAEAS
ncbi:periplasmic protein thiol:disulfide oxidoreductase, DsbE subfamily protein [Oceanicola granulosus HTCC2516]|uniref:Periplasmic protein thiol:disulfide oxidoreductase, DsbE subfamily protein n=1 Tax=Oceanicola granulosus (strain ATCC BAA-861 / DSM 15982 / KCTC 12143 / HTCC2516) TaxID=314256 RepID=Q2CHS3_OCEGH|nr:periplasmic protein thiol:disulfide oxidoreductase, DsbE subfamily protein [Oceanicola granulosus HTCC2516]